MMSLYDGGSWILVGLLALGWGYSSYTAKDFSELRDFAQKHAMEIKEEYVKLRRKCREGNHGYKENKLCQKIKEIDPEARELWKKLKKADDKAEVIEENLHKLETIKELIKDVSGAISG